MKKITYITTIILLSYSLIINAQKTKTDANIIGHVTNSGKHLSFVSIGLKGTTIGTVTDETGHYQLINLPTGEQFITVSMIGYKPQEKKVLLENGQTIEIKFDLEEDVLNINEVVVSADRSQQKRTEAPVIVNTISPKLFETSQSITLGEGLCFSPGLRLENNCQNCGFSQVRMNGMEGPYSQILINSRPIFSGLAGVYGLELIPSNMIDKVEVVRGGGSALFGSNAIAGTINIIMKDPKTNSYEAGTTYGLTGTGTDGKESTDYTVNFNASAVSENSQSGLSVYGFTRDREMYDANNDEFSEITPIKNITFGGRAFHKFGHRDKLALDFFSIKEQRDGGSDQDYPLHQRRVGEVVTHNMNVAATTYECFFREYDLLSVYASGQFLNRDSYYGAGYSTSDYGNSKDNTYNFGVQYKAVFNGSSLIAGIENTSGYLTDKKLGAPIFVQENSETIIIDNQDHTIIADQSSITTGIFAQYDITINKLKASVGARFDNYHIEDNQNNGEQKKGGVFSPRISLMYEIINGLQGRLTYSQGYRAPQIFDEDLHIETSGSRQVIHKNDADLKQETSHSYMASLDYNKLFGKVYTGFLIEGFYTKLEDAFSNEMSDPVNGVVTYTRINSTGAAVKGVNMELRLKPLKNFEMSSGFTLQTSEYEKIQDDFPEKRFFRTPDHYGFLAIDWDFVKGFCLSTTGNYTGSMLVPYFGTECETFINDVGDEEVIGQLRKSDSFIDLGAKLSYKIKLNGASVEFSGGIKNMFNSYQNDFDKGINRDPAYIYGPVSPRTVYFGIKFGNLL